MRHRARISWHAIGWGLLLISFSATAGIAAASVAVAPTQNDYVYDDGSSEAAWGVGSGGDICALHRFDASGGSDTITRIDVAFGHSDHPGTAPPEGTPVTLCIWEDPNDDGDPLDAILLSIASGSLQNPHTDILNPFPTPPTAVSGVFFVGYFLSNESGEFPCAMDGSQYSNGRAWIAASLTQGGFNPEALSQNDFPPADVDSTGLTPGVWLLRAFGEGDVGTAYCFGDGGGTACPCGNEADPGSGSGCQNSSGLGSIAVGFGSNSVGSDDLMISARQLLPSQPALLFAGTEQINGGNGIPFGDGLRCAGTNVVRLGVKTPDAAGVATWGPGLGTLGNWGSGDVRRFQAWYRNPQGSPCSSGFNLSNGLEVVFAP